MARLVIPALVALLERVEARGGPTLAPEVEITKVDTPERPPKADLTTPDAFEYDISLLQFFEFRGTINALSEAGA